VIGRRPRILERNTTPFACGEKFFKATRSCVGSKFKFAGELECCAHHGAIAEIAHRSLKTCTAQLTGILRADIQTALAMAKT
jgi:hypothetical protein